MGIGFKTGREGLSLPSDNDLLVPGPDYGLSVKQMQVLGLTNDAMTKIPEIKAVSEERHRGDVCVEEKKGEVPACTWLTTCVFIFTSISYNYISNPKLNPIPLNRNH
jgi:hypothetical protein